MVKIDLEKELASSINNAVNRKIKDILIDVTNQYRFDYDYQSYELSEDDLEMINMIGKIYAGKIIDSCS